ncbi:MAG: hypothetical protein J6X18_09045 [Bacteroidales bacterium]|nr:hypothetical protein [Bacteroidales bacterium]
MNLLEEYQKLVNGETDNEFPETMQYDGLSEGDRDMYEEVLNKMRADMDKASKDMRKKSSSWGDVCEEVNGEIQNKKYKMSEDMIRQRNAAQFGQFGKMVSTFEYFGLSAETFRCPKCGKVMYEDGEQFVCSSCGYSEESNGRHTKFYFTDKEYNRIPLAVQDNDFFVQMIRRANKEKTNR